jgi:thiol-disulfide isomerase/thioredoxin
MNKQFKNHILTVVLIGLLVYLGYGTLRDNVGAGPVLTEPVDGVEQATVFYFYTEGCPACRRMAPTLDAVMRECGGGPVAFRKVNPMDDDSRALGREFKIEAVPTTSFVDAQGREKARHVGAFSKSRFLGDLAMLADEACPDRAVN